MREIKFRAWDRKLGSMVEETFFLTNYGTMYIGFHGVENDMTTTDLNEKIELMQYTGLHDKNGKEIYEGDICHISYPTDCPEPRTNNERNGVVVYDDEIPGFRLYNNFLYQSMRQYGYVEFQVIGNIYENPEVVR